MAEQENKDVEHTRNESIDELIKRLEKARNDESIEIFMVSLDKTAGKCMHAVLGTVDLLGTTAEILLREHPEVVAIASWAVQRGLKNED